MTDEEKIDEYDTCMNQMDNVGIPRDKNGILLSIWGRICLVMGDDELTTHKQSS
jgi:hypothetical protein